MPITIRTVSGVHISVMKRIAIYVFGKKNFIRIIETNGVVVILVQPETNDKEIARFEEYWDATVQKFQVAGK